jgi:hypothetical protein
MPILRSAWDWASRKQPLLEAYSPQKGRTVSSELSISDLIPWNRIREVPLSGHCETRKLWAIISARWKSTLHMQVPRTLFRLLEILDTDPLSS